MGTYYDDYVTAQSAVHALSATVYHALDRLTDRELAAFAFLADPTMIERDYGRFEWREEVLNDIANKYDLYNTGKLLENNRILLDVLDAADAVGTYSKRR